MNLSVDVSVCLRQNKKKRGKRESAGMRRRGRDAQYRISLLINAMYYFIESVFIVEREGRFRLLAIHQGYLLVDEYYDTCKGARIAFLKFFGYKAWEEDVKAQWTPFYYPDARWLNQKESAKPPEPVAPLEEQELTIDEINALKY